MEQREQRHSLQWPTKFFQVWSLLKCPAHNYCHDIVHGGKSPNTPWRPYILSVQLHGGGNLMPLPISVSPLRQPRKPSLRPSENKMPLHCGVSALWVKLEDAERVCFRRSVVLCGITWMSNHKDEWFRRRFRECSSDKQTPSGSCLLPLGLLSIQVSSLS